MNKIRRLYGTKRVGHTGTLDPLATGVLVVLIGRAAKAAEYLVADTKRYRAGLRFGLESDSEDITGNVTATSVNIPTKGEVLAVAREFVGDIKQIPPMYSAIKVGGRKLVDLAREGITVERQAREVTVFELDIEPTDTPSDYVLDVFCSSGTYIRTLCADIGKRLGSGAVMTELERREAGGFNIENSHTVEEIEAMSEEERLGILVPTEMLFSPLKEIRLPLFYERLSRNGCEIYQKKIKIVQKTIAMSQHY